MTTAAEFVLVMVLWFDDAAAPPAKHVQLEGFTSEAVCMHAGARFVRSRERPPELQVWYWCVPDEQRSADTRFADRLSRAAR